MKLTANLDPCNRVWISDENGHKVAALAISQKDVHPGKIGPTKAGREDAAMGALMAHSLVMANALKEIAAVLDARQEPRVSSALAIARQAIDIPGYTEHLGGGEVRHNVKTPFCLP